MGRLLRDPRPSRVAGVAGVAAALVLHVPASHAAPASEGGVADHAGRGDLRARPAAASPLPSAPSKPPPQTDARPPRIDGPYVGGLLLTGVTLARVQAYDTAPFTSLGGALRFGEMVLPWLGLGLQLGGSSGIGRETPRQRLGQGGLLVDTVFVPLAGRGVPLSLRASFGFGGGAVTQEGTEGRSGYGGARFAGSVAYTFFPWAHKKRAFRGGGFGLGPELGWTGFPPTGVGRPMSNTVWVALTTTFYFGA